MAVDEKYINGEFYTLLTNGQTGKIALMASTTKTALLTQSMKKFSDIFFSVKILTRDMASNYDRINQLIPNLAENFKTSSNAWINENRLSKSKFDWQIGYGAFSHSMSNIDRVVKFILNQEKHHQKTSFKSEYLKLLIDNGIEYKDDYLFDFSED